MEKTQLAFRLQFAVPTTTWQKETLSETGPSDTCNPGEKKPRKKKKKGGRCVVIDLVTHQLLALLLRSCVQVSDAQALGSWRIDELDSPLS